MPLTAPPTAPSTADPSTFSTRMDAMLAWMATLVTEANALETNVNTKESATNADAIATAADRVQTGLDAVATAGDRVQTGLDRIAAAASAASAAAIAGAFTGTSTTSLSIGSGSKAFTTQSGEQYSAGIWMTAVSAADPANYMFGEVTSYSGTALVIDVQAIGGSGTHADWNLSLAGPRGPQGVAGTLSGNAVGGINELKGPDIASAATTMDIWAAAQGNKMTVTGTTPTSGLPAAPQAGASRTLIAAGLWPLTNGANFIVPGGDRTCAAGDIVEVTALTTTQFRLKITKADGTPVVSNAAALPYLHVREEQTSNTAGGTFTSGAWRTRVLNTTVKNSIPSASLSSNQITLPAGTYRISARAPGNTVGAQKAKLANITDATDQVIGSATDHDSTNRMQLDSWVHGYFTIAGAKVFELRHQCGATRATDGLGAPGGFSAVEVYAEVMIWKEA
jgi:hypothetical protein